MQKHTPGPWEYFQGDICHGKPEERERILQCPGRMLAADADLIAAAPDLLEALREMWQSVSECNPEKRCRGLIKAGRAIAKAEGRFTE